MADGETHTALYLLPDGSQVPGRANAIVVSAQDIAAAVGPYTALPPGFFVGMAERETGSASNECDIDYNADGSVKARTYGLFQLSRGDAIAAGDLAAAADPTLLCEVDRACRVVASVMADYRDAICIAAGVGAHDGYHGAPPAAVLWYMAWAHNNGLPTVLRSIASYNLDVDALKARPQNDYVVSKLIPYADTIVASCDEFPVVLPPDIDDSDPDAVAAALEAREPSRLPQLVTLLLVVGAIYYLVVT